VTSAVEVVTAEVDVCSHPDHHRPHLRPHLWPRQDGKPHDPVWLWCLGQYDQSLQLCLALVRVDGDHEDLLLIGPKPWDGNDDPAASLQAAAAVIAWADGYLHHLAAKVRSNGVSYARIGAALGVSRQAAWERFSKARS
jgi:hypothetical protein